MLFIRLVSTLWVAASIYWVYSEPTNFEPKVSLLGSCFSLLSFVYSPHRGADVFITLNDESNERNRYRFMLNIENRGDRDAHDLRITFPDSFRADADSEEVASVPKLLRAGETKKIRAFLHLGSPPSFDFEWSWRGAGWRRHTRSSVVRVE